MDNQQAAAATATAFSRKLSGGGLSGKHVYDGVFGEGGRVGGRVVDYREIFGGRSSGCSIPVLDVPELNEAKVTVDTRSSSLEYSKIFGGFGDAEFAVPYEKLVLKPKKRRGGSSTSSSSSSSHEARAPAEPRSRVAGEERTTFSEEKNGPSPEASFKSFDGTRQFNVSYHKASPGCKSGMNGTTHITQLHAMPGYTCLIHEGTPAVAKPARSVLNDAHAKINISERIKDARPPRKAVSGPQPRYNAVDIRKKSSRSKSISDDFSFDAFEASLGTELPRNPPPPSSLHNIRTVRSMNVKFGVTRTDASEDIAGNCSPTFLDEEVDENSAAAASAAAVIKAIEEAQMKIQIAKELMERKKEGLQNREKLSFSNGVKAEKRQLKLAEKANRSKDGEAREKFDEGGPPSQPFESVFDHNTKKASQVNPGFLDEKELCGDITAVEGASQPISIPPVHCVEEARDEMAMRELSEASGSREHGDTPRDHDKTDHAEKIMETTGENECIEKTIMEENINKPEECHEYKVAVKQEDEKKLNSVESVFTWDIYRNSIKLDQESNHLEGNQETISIVHEHQEADQVPNLSCEEENCTSKLKDFQKLEEDAKLKIQELEENKDVKEVNEAVDLGEIDKTQREVHNQENLAALLDEVPEAEEDGRKLHEIHGHEESGKGHQGDGEWVECAMELEEDGDQEWYEAETGIESGNIHEEEVSNVILNDLHDFEESQRVDTIKAITDAKQNLEGTNENEKAFEEETGIKSCDVHEEEATSVTYDDIQDYEESERSCSCDDKPEENQDLEGTRENMKVLKEDFQVRTTKEDQEGTCEGVEPEMIKSDIGHRAENENVEWIEKFFEYHEDLESADYAYRMDKNTDLSVSEEACVSQEELRLTADVLTLEENGKMRDENELPFESKETGGESKATEEANDQDGEESFDIAAPEKMDFSEPLIVGKDGVPLCETDLNFEQQQEKHQETEYEGSCNWEKHAQELICELDENDNDVSNSDIGSNSGEKQLDDGVECKVHYDSEKHVEEVAWELGDKEIDEKESEFVTNPEKDQKSVESSSEEQSMDNGIDVEAREEPCVFEEKGKDMEMSQERSNSTDKKGETDQNTLTTEERKSEDRPKEMEAEKNHCRRKEVIQERDIQKERERIVVERAIREARERAFAEARGKADRAAAERTAAEARERLGKASVEANNKLAADKAMEAKIKAERAAVERATAEARERALEKALSEKARMRNQSGKFAAEKSFGASRDDAMKSKDQQCKVSGASGSSRYPDSSNHGVPHSTERCSGPTGESALRCKATLERHQRTAERTAKALAEKNMRDLHAQKEQAERNRLAETLDSEVKRWSSGKERNLRALLSTLQYILGPDSGWQPIPLTDLIATTAVKKAYRKATLFVHPDKLQQRGATIQQKYTCEKVFDLLKEAWNKFSAEER